MHIIFQQTQSIHMLLRKNHLCLEMLIIHFRDVNSWPEPYICTVYDHMHGDFLAINIVYTPYIYGYCQP